MVTKPWKPAVGSVPHVGETIKEIIDDSHFNQTWWAEQLGVTTKHVSYLVNGKVSLAAWLAVGFEELCGVDADLLMTMQAHYEVDQARLVARP